MHLYFYAGCFLGAMTFKIVEALLNIYFPEDEED